MKQDKKFIILLLLVMMGGCESTNSKDIPSPILATVNQDSITVEDFNRFLSEQSLQPGLKNEEQPPLSLIETMIDELIERHLLLQEAHRQQKKVTDPELEEAIQQIKGDYTPPDFDTLLQEEGVSLSSWREQIRTNLLIQKILFLNIDQKISVSAEEMMNYYETHKKDFRVPEQVKARHIVSAKEEEAKEIRQTLLQGVPFGSLAKEKSISPDGKKGGDLGLLKRGEMPEAFDVVFSLKESAISPIVESPYGFHIFHVEKKFLSRNLTYEEVQLQIQNLIFQKKREKLYQEWIQDLKSASAIKINLSVLHAKT